MKYQNPRIFLRRIIFFIIIILLLVFIYSRYGRYVGGPGIKNISLDEINTSREGFVRVEGQFKNAKSAQVNGNILILDPEQGFRKDVALQPGDNIIDVEVTDPFGNTRNYTYHVFSQQDESEKPEPEPESMESTEEDILEIEISLLEDE